jgi:hypothetical protein
MFVRISGGDKLSSLTVERCAAKQGYRSIWMAVGSRWGGSEAGGTARDAWPCATHALIMHDFQKWELGLAQR